MDGEKYLDDRERVPREIRARAAGLNTATARASQHSNRIRYGTSPCRCDQSVLTLKANQSSAELTETYCETFIENCSAVFWSRGTVRQRSRRIRADH
jgi:hypothetical protein